MSTNVKVSGTGWLCVILSDGAHIPVCKLTPTQIQEYIDVEKRFIKGTPSENDIQNPVDRRRSDRTGILHRTQLVS